LNAEAKIAIMRVKVKKLFKKTMPRVLGDKRRVQLCISREKPEEAVAFTSLHGFMSLEIQREE